MFNKKEIKKTLFSTVIFTFALTVNASADAIDTTNPLLSVMPVTNEFVLTENNYINTGLNYNINYANIETDIAKIDVNEETNKENIIEQEIINDIDPDYIAQKSIIDGYDNLGVVHGEEKIEIYEDVDSDVVIGTINEFGGCEINEKVNDYYNITSSNVTGYIKKDNLYTGKKANIVATEHFKANVKLKNDDTKIYTNKKCSKEYNGSVNELVLDKKDQNVYKVKKDDDVLYVKKKEAKVTKTLNVAKKKKVVKKDTSLYDDKTIAELKDSIKYDEKLSKKQNAVLQYAKQFLGNPYVWGGTSLTNGCDCSGFTMRIYEHFGYSLNRVSRDQKSNGTNVKLTKIKAGDLVFYKTDSERPNTISHVAMYIGNGKIIHASTEETGIIISNLIMNTPPCAATRIID